MATWIDRACIDYLAGLWDEFESVIGDSAG
jgi:hypothetical protein